MSILPDLPASANGADPWPASQARLTALASALPYPPTPNLAAVVLTRVARPPRPAGLPAVRGWLLAAALGAVVVLAAALLAVPGVRAGLLHVLELGGVRFLLEPEPTTGAPPTVLPPSVLLSLAGETTLDEARARVSFPIRLPAYPPDLGAPDHVYVQGVDDVVVVLAWVEPGSTGEVRLALYILGAPAVAEKLLFEALGTPAAGVEATTVNGQPAAWTTGPYVLRTRFGGLEELRLIEGHTLIWFEDGLTYRLETDLELREAILIAESLEE
jgi:hypothetical protein